MNLFKIGIDKRLTTSLALGVLLLFPFVASANFVEDVLNRFVKEILWPIFIGSTIIMIIYAGVLFVTAAGDPGQIGKAKQAVLWAVIGIIVGIVAFSAYTLIKNVVTPIP